MSEAPGRRRSILSPRLRRIVAYVVVLLVATWYVVRAEGHADKAERTAAALTAEIHDRIVDDCEGANDSRRTIRRSFAVVFESIAATVPDPEETKAFAARIDADLEKDLPVRDCAAVAAEAINAAQQAAHPKEK